MPARLEVFAPGSIWFTPYTTKAPAGLRFPCRTVVVRLASGALLLHSPGPIDDALAAELAELGPVEHLVAPNSFHHLHASAVKARYPDATLWAPPGLRQKVPGLAIDATLGEGAPPPWGDELACVLVEAGPKMCEAVFHHAPTRTLLVTDLVFNLRAVDGWWTRTVLRLVGAFGSMQQSRLWRRFTRDRDAARAAVERVLRWDIDHVVPSHGAPISGPEAREALTGALWWMRGAARP